MDALKDCKIMQKVAELQKKGLPFGYDWKVREDGKVVGLQQNKLEATDAWIMFFMARCSKTNWEIAAQFCTYDPRDRTGKRWSEEEINDILTNPLYAGYVLPDGKWTGHDEQVEELIIVGYETWEIVQSLRSPVITEKEAQKTCRNGETALQSPTTEGKERGKYV